MADILHDRQLQVNSGSWVHFVAPSCAGSRQTDNSLSLLKAVDGIVWGWIEEPSCECHCNVAAIPDADTQLSTDEMSNG